MSTPNDRPATAAQNEADVLEQQASVVPEAQEDTGIQDPVRPHGDPLRPDGSEADRLEQDADGGAANSDEDEYPREREDEERS
ncbi:hypothetical protein QNO08_15905 [Arthrobacter sp. zg-Y820]|uniref:hypothetical protein n=1 Tax=unclassified Arthrobacter TaxID=235627 RepID=UPI001E51C8B1|nr:MULTISPECIES: hypothetical protein [unclassified Arthrobacter]MCC9197123.1 hypothetical protein [Arthrobacter sp. zg-Y820]MDK1279988.1 hypothetical protein [Arthrobacter sp. zg.Y820]WIB09287.1 hypothetical protein QNO08_15905 [Arthrobacter sp. zg-Y820]